MAFTESRNFSFILSACFFKSLQSGDTGSKCIPVKWLFKFQPGLPFRKQNGGIVINYKVTCFRVKWTRISSKLLKNNMDFVKIQKKV